MRRIALLPMLLFVIAECAAAGDAFERITPAQAGYSEQGLATLRQVLADAGSESMLLVHKGKVFFEWGDIRRKRLVHSIRKPLLHALIGQESGTCWCRTKGIRGRPSTTPALASTCWACTRNTDW